VAATWVAVVVLAVGLTPAAWADDGGANEAGVAAVAAAASAPAEAPASASASASAPAPAPAPASAPASASASGGAARPATATARAYDVKVHEKTTFSLKVARAGQSAQDRARAASRALETVIDDPEQPTTHVEEEGGNAVIFVGKSPIVTLSDDDAAAAGGDTTVHVYAATVATRIDDALRAERRRSAIATRVFSFSLLVFSGLIAFLLFRLVGDLSERARNWVRDNPDGIPALRLGRVEVVRPVAVRGAVSIALALAHRIALFGVMYLWLIFALSLFEATRSYTDRLAGIVLTPLSALLGRVGAALPLFVVAIIAVVAMSIAVRFVGLFFGGVARGETHLTWLPRELAGPTSVLVRAGMVLASIVLASPLITGTDDGALSRAGIVALVALGLAGTPLLACAAAGVPVVFGRHFKPGDYVETGGRAGVVRDVTLLEVVLEDAIGCEVRIPQLLGLWHPTRVLGSGAIATVEITVDPHKRPAEIEEALVGAAVSTCERARVELVSLDADGGRWKVSGVPRHGKGAASLADAIAHAIETKGISLGRASRRTETA
jgi:hypothetical protein